MSSPASLVSGDKWYHHFSKKGKEGVCGQNHGSYDEILNDPFTKDEIFTAFCGKAGGFDNISNEMLKYSPMIYCFSISILV